MKKALLILLIYLPLQSNAQLTNVEDVKPFCSNKVRVKTGNMELHNPDTPFTGFKGLTLQEVNDKTKAICFSSNDR